MCQFSHFSSLPGCGAAGTFTLLRPLDAFPSPDFPRRAGEQSPVHLWFSPLSPALDRTLLRRNLWITHTVFRLPAGPLSFPASHIPFFPPGIPCRDSLPPAHRLLSVLEEEADPASLWEFFSDTPEAVLFLTWLYSDLGAVHSLASLRSYGLRTQVWRGRLGQRCRVHCRLVPLRCPPVPEAGGRAGISPACLKREWKRQIDAGSPPEYILYIQRLPGKNGCAFPDPSPENADFWEESRCPLEAVGCLRLDVPLPGPPHPPFLPCPCGADGLEPEGPSAPASVSLAGSFYRSLSSRQRDRLAASLAAQLRPLPQPVRRKILRILRLADAGYSAQVRLKLSAPEPAAPTSAFYALSEA